MVTGLGCSPRVIGHRGSCGVLPEHTLASYKLAIDSKADAIELDVVTTRDRRLIVHHDAELSATTNIANVAGFAWRRTKRVIDGLPIQGWFADDFTLTEIKQLRARQRFPFRDHSQDDRHEVPTLDEALDLVAFRNQHKSLGIYIELKHAQHYADIGLSLEQPLLEALEMKRLLSAKSAVCIQSFEPGVLRSLRSQMGTRTVQLIESPSMVSLEQLQAIKGYADGIGVWKRLIVPTIGEAPDQADESHLRLGTPTSLVGDAHAAGLTVEAWTFRDEARFVAANYGGDPRTEYRQFFDLGVDGVITDFPHTALAARESSSGDCGRPEH